MLYRNKLSLSPLYRARSVVVAAAGVLLSIFSGLYDTWSTVLYCVSLSVYVDSLPVDYIYVSQNYTREGLVSHFKLASPARAPREAVELFLMWYTCVPTSGTRTLNLPKLQAFLMRLLCMPHTL
jgi:hypothetical protein